MYCILVTGIPASGKSTMADYFAKELDIPAVSKDTIKEILFDDVGFVGREQKVKLGIAAMDIMYYIAGRLMQRNQAFILENNFEDASYDKLMEILNTYGYTAVTVRLTGDYEKIYERFAKRDRSPDRHRGHVVNDRYPELEGQPIENPTALSLEGYLSGIEKRGYDRFAANGPVITVDTTDFSHVDYGRILERVKEAAAAMVGE